MLTIFVVHNAKGAVGRKNQGKEGKKPTYSTFHSSKESVKVRAFIIEFQGNALFFDTFPIKKLKCSRKVEKEENNIYS